jgi:uncharacterized protein YjbI with pentapeptide repeats
MAENEGQSESQEKQPGRRFSQEQYDMLIRCSEKKGMTEWNDWRRKHPNELILLENAPLENADLRFANLENADLSKAHLENANLRCAHLEHSSLWEAHLENASLSKAHLENVYLSNAYLENANLSSAHLENDNLEAANLENVDLIDAHLENTRLWAAHLENARLEGANLRGTDFSYAYLQGANCNEAIVDGETLIWDCKIDRNTKFEGVGLESARVQPQIKQLLEYNTRRTNWEEWYRGKSKKKWVVKLHQLMTSPVRLFWCISNYGLSTKRIIFTFFAMAIIFATVYFTCGAVDYYHSGIKEQPGIVKDLFVPVTDEGSISGVYYGAMIYFRSVYFSVVTMTTLGFGDMFANTSHLGWRWWVGHSLLILQVILGYVLLGALVTRFAVLFTAGGPAGKFAKEIKKSKRK